MKKHLYPFFVVLLLVCCTGEKPNDLSIKEQEAVVMKTPNITMERALKIAAAAPGEYEEVTKSSEKSVKNVQVILSEVSKESGKRDTLLYVVNYENDKGYVFVSSDLRNGEILAYVEEGNFNIQDTVGNSLLKFLYDRIVGYQTYQLKQIKAIDKEMELEIAMETKGVEGETGETGPTTETTNTYMIRGRSGPMCDAVIGHNRPYDWDWGEPVSPPRPDVDDYYYKTMGCILEIEERVLLTGRVDPLLTTSWGQKEPYNGWLPNVFPTATGYPMGCVATATAQIMAYHSSPARFPQDWYSGGPTYIAALRGVVDRNAFYLQHERMRDDVAKFFLAIACDLEMDFGPDGSSASDKKVIPCLKKWGYPTSELKLEDYNLNAVLRSLNISRPVYITAYRDWWHTKGHAWIIDGYKRPSSTYYYWKYYFDDRAGYNGKRLTSYYSPATMYELHCNYGWNGNQNGWFQSGIFTYVDDDGDRQTYQYKIEIICNISKL